MTATAVTSADITYGATSADHVIPRTERPELAMDMSNLKAVHAFSRNQPGGCKECTQAALKNGAQKAIYCNQLKSMGSIERARRIIEERTGLKLFENQFESQGKNNEPEGREW